MVKYARKIADAFILGAVVSLAAAVPGGAQTLNVPQSSGVWSIQTETLFHEFFADFFSRKRWNDVRANGRHTGDVAAGLRADYRVWEDKWEIDSLAWPVLLVFVYYANTRDRTIFSPTLHTALRTIARSRP
jgi:meiotically up-regulated gene 157 (Mug157) protein